MMLQKNLLTETLKVVNVGLDSFYNDLKNSGAEAVHVDWRPPANGNIQLGKWLAAMEARNARIEHANKIAMDKLINSQPRWIDIGLAQEVIPGIKGKIILHSGPPIAWQNMCGPVRGAILGAAIYEGWAADVEQATALMETGEVIFSPCHDYGAVGPMAGIISPSMPVVVVENDNSGNVAFSNFNEGLGKVLRFGANSAEVLDRLRWMKNVLAPVLGAAIRDMGGIDLKALIARALQMGDECHNRNNAATSLLMRELSPFLIRHASKDVLEEIFTFLGKNDHFFLNLSMAACKVSLDAAHGIKDSTMVTAMARNGVEFGIRVSGAGNEWFTAPAPPVDGLYFSGYTVKDANPDLGDSAITETFGIGGFAMAAAPAIVQFVGGSAQDALEYTKEMYEITIATNPAFSLPALDFKATPAGIDLLKVIETGITPLINTGVAHREAGVGQIGAGVVRAPFACFEKALEALNKTE
ncbi:hypothetical protein SRRS_35490 [Sporomusa rhizae]|uniref:DUF1116 domain-containing protein n=1 Tax=Sporomusa rhizae TaxID=357999 RepID=UPI00352B3DD7